MNYFPLFARLEGIRCLVVGGGEVAARKVRSLLRAGASITVMAPDILPELADLAKAGTLELRQMRFTPELIEDYQLIIAATTDREINKTIADAATAAKRFCNVVDDGELSSVIFPAVVDRSPLLIAVTTGGNSPVLATRIRQALDSFIPPAMAELADFAGRWRTAVQTQIGDPDDRRRFWQSVFEGPIAELVLAGRTLEAENAMNRALKTHEPEPGIAWIVGAGPGDPELLTLKAARILRSADVVLHDRLVASAILDMARRDAEIISVGKQAGRASISQDEINSLLVRLVREGKRVCRLKGGDPFIFGRGGEEIEALENAGLLWQVVPGITAASGCAAAAGVPLTHRNVSRAVVLATAQAADDFEPDWPALARGGQTVVFYMAVSQLAKICAELVSAGRSASCPALLIENGCTPRERRIQGTLDTLPARAREAGAASPALLIIGEVAQLIWQQQSGMQEAAPAKWWSPTAGQQTNG